MGKYNRIIFVGDNGTCRAPMAAEIFRSIHMADDLEIYARGIVVLFPEPMNQKAEAVMVSNGHSMESYMSSQLEAEDIAEDTLLFTLENKHKQKVLELFPEMSEEQIQVLSEFVGDELETVDPYGGSLQVYGICYETLLSSIKKLESILAE